MENALLDFLCSPADHAQLRFALAEELARINASIRLGQLRNRSGSAVEGEVENCLVCEQGQYCFPIRDGFPVLLTTETFSIPNPR
jgi:uncharacterized protein YbaR (Trm112 family)